MTVRGVVRKAQDLWAGFGRDGGGLLAAAVAYNTLFALAPALMLVTVAGEVLLGRAEVADRLFASAVGALGPSLAAQLEDVVNAYLATRQNQTGAGLLSVGLLVLAVGGLFGKLQQAFAMLWHVRVRDDLPLATKARLLASRFLFAGLPIALAATALAVAALSGWVASLLGVPASAVARVVESPLVVAVLAVGGLVVLYRLLPYAVVRTSDVVWPAVAVAVAWTAGSLLFGLYLVNGTGTAAGAAGSLFALLLWLNYSSMVLLLGCSACRLIAEHHGRGGPGPYAEPAFPQVPKR